MALLATAPLLRAQTDAAPTASTASTGFLAERITIAGKEHRYVLFVPPGYDGSRRWPLIVFLNGAGECGADGWQQVSVGLGPAIMHDVAAWPFLVLFPQKPDVRSAWEDHDALVMAMLQQVQKQRAVDERQLFLTGLSQGGHGTWVLGARHAELWAAIAPVCGYGSPSAVAKALRAMPIWCFHGEDDKSVAVKQSKDLVAAVADAGGFPRLSLYPHTGHNAWDKAYRDEPLAQWFLTIARDRAAAPYVTRPDLVGSATIEVQDQWTTDAVTAERPSRGTTTLTVTLAADGLSWREVTRFDKAAGMTDPEPRTGKLDGQEGRELLLQQLRALVDGGVLALPQPIEPRQPDGFLMASHQYRIDVALDGKPGPYRFHRDVPAAAQFDARYQHAVRCLAAFVAAFAARH